MFLSASFSLLPLPLAAREAVDFTIEINGVDNDELRSALTDANSLRGATPRSPRALVRLAREQKAELETILNSFAHYAGRADIMIAGTPAEDVTAFAAARQYDGRIPVTFNIAPGPKFGFGTIDITVIDADNLSDTTRARLAEPLTLFGYAENQAATAERILSADSRLIRFLEGRGHFSVTMLERRAIADHETGRLALDYRIAAGPVANFGPVTITGLEKTDPDFARDLVTIAPGTRFDPEQVDAVYDALGETALFSRIEVSLPERPDENGQLPVTIRLTEALSRSIGFGAQFETSQGIGISADWENRNILGKGETLSVEAEIRRLVENSFGDLDFRLTNRFEKPRFFRPDQTLITDLIFERGRTDAFDSLGVSFDLSAARRINDRLTVTAGGLLAFSRLTDNDSTDTVYVTGFPISALYDASDDRLNPTEGWRGSVTLTPFPGFLGTQPHFAKLDTRLSAYIDLKGLVGSEDGRRVLALRGRLGSIASGDADDVPADRRFFAGGGGSVRGYDFQSLAPRDSVTGDPRGGRSILELSGELRIRIGESWGIVPFIDAGNAYDAVIPDFDRNVRVAGGIGVRYYTPIGPLRLDIARAINPGRRTSDIAVFLSIGQAF